MDQLDAGLLKTSNPAARRYATRPGGFEEIRREMVLRMTLVMAISTIVVYTVLFYKNGLIGGWVGVVPYLFPLGAMIYALVNAIRKQRILFESFVLTVEDDAFLRQQKNMTDLRILKKDVKSITRNSKGIITIKGAGFQDVIAIPAQMEMRQQMEQELAAISPITFGNPPVWKKALGVAGLFAFLGVAGLAFTATSKTVVAVSGILFSAGFAFAIIFAARSKHLEKRLRWGLLLAFIPWLSFSSAIYSRWKAIPAQATEARPAKNTDAQTGF